MFDVAAFSFAELLPYILVGFCAQLVDGALGMAFGVISTTLLVSRGVDPAVASASVHTVEMFTTGAYGISHTLHRNVNWRLFRRIVNPGMNGGLLGAYVLAYLTAIGFYLLWRALRHQQRHRNPRLVEPLGLVGGFLDAAGGGGWGPVVTSNLLAQGAHPRKVIGTVNTAEFFIALTISLTFLLTLSAEAITTPMLGLLIGGIAAAPLGGLVAKRLPAKPLLIMVSVVLILTSAYGIWRSLA